ncbi:Cof-type HAD-IIB family hydrolase [Erysipelothrix anatis]|uniref:Cof-type HAD-IIB family hydrolase n=1 Tax=Erysipelothrix anatis TaxID=2683713 RepID=UPI00140E7EDD|nr:Cof-type HAD-IIB family hydrolase [Erysipelothrix anatis]
MKKIGTVVLSIDGTLLNSKKRITKKTKEALIKIQENGVKVILASSRPTSGINLFVEELEMDKHNGLIISFNGAMVIDCRTKEVLYSKSIDHNSTSKLLGHLKKFEVYPIVFHDNYMYVNNVFVETIDTYTIFNKTSVKTIIIEYEAHEGNFLLCEIDDLATFIDFPLYKVLITAQPNYLKENYMEIMDPFKNSLNCVFSTPHYFEFTDKDVDKASALANVLITQGQKQESVMAFGDAQNDLTMIKYAGVGVAMENAEDDVLDNADEVTDSNDDDGIAVKLFEYFPEIFKNNR